MELPEVLAIEVEYVEGEGGEKRSTTINFTSTHRTYTAESQDMECRLYETNDLEGIIRPIGILVNDLTVEAYGVKAAIAVVRAIAECDIKRFYFPGTGGIKFPLKSEMVDGDEDGTVRPTGFAGCVRYVSGQRFNTTTVAVLPYFRQYIPE